MSEANREKGKMREGTSQSDEQKVVRHCTLVEYGSRFAPPVLRSSLPSPAPSVPLESVALGFDGMTDFRYSALAGGIAVGGTVEDVYGALFDGDGCKLR